MINRKFFYDSIRKPLFGKISSKQLEGMEAILDYWENESGLTDLRWLAYILATAFHETAATMQPIKEYGTDEYFIKRYWKNKKIREELGNLSPQDAVCYCGKGLVQITGRRNYAKMGKILEIPLLENSDLALDLYTSVQIIFEGMTTAKSFAGDFTGKHLGNYFNKKVEDWYNARRIVNGTDRAALIAANGKTFYQALMG